MTIPKPPRGLGAPGRRIWDAVLKDYELEEHELVLLVQAVRAADSCDELQAIITTDGRVIDGQRGPKMHPAVAELRQQQLVLARLLAALRVPLGEETLTRTKQGTPRLQRRGGARGIYSVKPPA
jgi:hypothetical protein